MHNLLAIDLCQALPLKSDQMTVRPCARADLDLLASWSPYPWPYHAFNFSFRSSGPSERDSILADQVQADDRITLVCDHGSNATIGYIALLRIDWQTRAAENMSLRVHPDWCGRGIGTRMLQLVGEWWFGLGMQALQLDVAATNQHAVRCYLKAGFTHAREFWRKAPDLQGVDIEDARYDFLREHLRLSGPIPEIRFYWMRRATGAVPSAPGARATPGGVIARQQGENRP